MVECYKDEQSDNGKLRRIHLIHQTQDDNELMDAYYERIGIALADAMPDEHVNTGKMYISIFESYLRADIYCKYRDTTSGKPIFSIEIARNYAVD